MTTLMQIRSFRGSGKPVWVNALSSTPFRLGPDPRTALGPAASRAASTGRTRDRTRPMLQQRQKVLARAPSTRDPKRTLHRSGSRCAGKPAVCASYMCDLASEETSVESMSELLDELERVRDRQEKIIALLRKSSLRPDVRFTLDDAIKQAERDLDEYNALLTRYGRSGNAARP